MIRLRGCSLAALLISLAACAPAATPSPTMMPTVEPTSTSIPMATSIPIPPTATNTRMPTVTPLPTSIPAISVSFAASNGEMIEGKLYGQGTQAIILSNTDDNDPSSWDPVVPELARDHLLLTYTYKRSDTARTEDLKDALAFIRKQGAKKIILIGASRGGIASVQVAADPQNNPDVIALAAISAPRHFDGTTFYSDEMLKAIQVPKLLINSEHDQWAKDTQEMYDLMGEPKELHFYPGGAHGTDTFYNYRDDLVQRLVDFVKTNFAGK